MNAVSRAQLDILWVANCRHPWDDVLRESLVMALRLDHGRKVTEFC